MLLERCSPPTHTQSGGWHSPFSDIIYYALCWWRWESSLKLEYCTERQPQSSLPFLTHSPLPPTLSCGYAFPGISESICFFPHQEPCLESLSPPLESLKLKQAGTWDLGPFAAVLAPGQTSPQATDAKTLWGTKNNCVHVQLGQILDKKLQKDQKAQLPLLNSWERKQGTAHAPCTQHHRRVGRPPKSQWSLAWISCVASRVNFYWLVQAENPGRYQHHLLTDLTPLSLDSFHRLTTLQSERPTRCGNLILFNALQRLVLRFKLKSLA